MLLPSAVLLGLVSVLVTFDENVFVSQSQRFLGKGPYQQTKMATIETRPGLQSQAVLEMMEAFFPSSLLDVPHIDPALVEIIQNTHPGLWERTTTQSPNSSITSITQSLLVLFLATLQNSLSCMPHTWFLPSILHAPKTPWQRHYTTKRQQTNPKNTSLLFSVFLYRCFWLETVYAPRDLRFCTFVSPVRLTEAYDDQQVMKLASLVLRYNPSHEYTIFIFKTFAFFWPMKRGECFPSVSFSRGKYYDEK